MFGAAYYLLLCTVVAFMDDVTNDAFFARKDHFNTINLMILFSIYLFLPYLYNYPAILYFQLPKDKPAILGCMNSLPDFKA